MANNGCNAKHMVSSFSRNLKYFLLTLLCCRPVLAQEISSSRYQCDYARLITNAKSEFQVPRAPWLEQSRAKVVTALTSVYQRLQMPGAREQASGWFDYLRWTELTKEVDRRNTEADTAIFYAVIERLYKPYAGLEFEEFVRLRNSLREYVALLSLSQSPDAESVYHEKLAAIDAILSRGQPSELSTEQIAGLGQAIAWLSDRGLAGELTRCVRHKFGFSNIQILASKKFIPANVFRPLSQVTPIRQYQFGAFVQGEAFTQARPKMVFIPSAETANVQIWLDGQTVTNAVASQKGVQVSTRLVTQHTSTKRLRFHTGGFYGEPAMTNAMTSASITGINPGRRLFQRLARGIAAKRASSRLPAARQQASQRVAKQASSQLDSRAAPLIDKVNAFYSEFFLAPLMRLGFGQLRPSTSSSSQALFANLTLARFDQLAAANAPPRLPGINDLEVGLHESAVANWVPHTMANQTVTADYLAKLAGLFLSRVPAALRPGTHTDNWSMETADRNPLGVRFRRQSVAATFRFDKFTRYPASPNDLHRHVYAEPFTVQVKYGLELQAGLGLRRIGQVEVAYENAAPEPDLEKFIAATFNGLFEERLTIPSLALPKVMAPYRSLAFNSVAAQSGWLKAGLKLH